MAVRTTIEWTGSTWNPLRARLREDTAIKTRQGLKVLPAGTWGYHCERVSPGCKYCYARAMNGRTLPAWGTGLDYAIANRGKVQIYLGEGELEKPLHWKRPRKIFPCSMTDMFAEFVPDELLDQIFTVMALCPQHTFQVVTKRAERMHRYLYFRSEDRGRQAARILNPLMRGKWDFPAGRTFPACLHRWPLPNVWLGVSVEDQQRADERIPWLLKTPAAKRFVSYEPALGPVDFQYYIWPDAFDVSDDCLDAPDGSTIGRFQRTGMTWETVLPALDWVITGGESGPGARPFDIQWARAVIAQCKSAGVACFVKQLGARPLVKSDGLQVPMPGLQRLILSDRKGGDMSEWAADLRVREYPDA